jgi:peptidoglycan/LPS O-acetylase OafA/YrhL
LYQNHNFTKIEDPYIIYFTAVFYFLIIILTFKKINDRNNFDFINRAHSDELKGIAILFVVIGHVGWHVLGPKSKQNFISFADFSVSLFFILSGYGLYLSSKYKELTGRQFLKNRLNRVLIPYWTATFIIVCIDYCIFNISYNLHDLLFTLSGINLSQVTKHIDYVRWYITVLLFWYIIFYIVYKIFYKNFNILIFSFFIIGITTTLLNYYILHLGYALLSFPFGVFLGINHDQINKILKNITKRKLWILILIFGLALSYFGIRTIIPKISNMIPYIFIVFAEEVLYILFSTCLIFITLEFNTSKLMQYIGKYSYDIFLLHGAFMVKYDTILFRGPIVFTFWFYFIIILIMSILFQRQNNKISSLI